MSLRPIREFRIPPRPEDLQTRPDEFPLALSPDHDVRFSDDLAERIVHDLGFHDPICILEQSAFDAAYILAKDVTSLGADLQTGFFEGIYTNLKILSNQIGQAKDKEEQSTQLTAAKVYLFLLYWIWQKIEKQHLSHQTYKHSNAQSPIVYTELRTQIFGAAQLMEGSLSAVASLLLLDLQRIADPSPVDRSMLDLCLSLVELFRASFQRRAWCLGVALFEELGDVEGGLDDVTAAALFLAVQKSEQLPSLVAELVQFTERTYDDDMLTRALILELTKGHPHDYSSQWEASKGRSQAIKSVSKLLESLSDSVPKSLFKQSAALEPYWCCTAYPIRSALVSAMGGLIQYLDAEGKGSKETEQHQMLDRLIQRFADVNAFTRSRCLTIWVQLTQQKCVPLPYWLEVTRIAAQRLHDPASTVRRAALCLLTALLEYNPFGTNMNTERFRATLELYRHKLQNYPPEQRDLEQEGEGRRSLAEPGTYQQICFVVQQLETAVLFTEVLTETMIECHALLGSPSVTVVQEVVHYLIACKQFSVKGSDAAMKAGLALIFSREQSLREEILTAFLQLYMDGEDELIVAQNVVNLAVDATVGELTCLEGLLKILLVQGRVTERLVKLWILIGLDRDSTPISISTQAKVKGAVFCLSVCAAHCPKLMAENLDALLQIGFVDGLSDGPCVSQICRVLKSIDPEFLDEEGRQDICCALVQTFFEQNMTEAEWFEVAENAVAALYSLFPTPDTLLEEVLTELSAKATSQNGEGNIVGGKPFLRFCYLLGLVAVHQMVYIEACADAIRARLAASSQEPKLDDPTGGDPHHHQELELDLIKQELESELLSPNGFLDHYAPMISTFCHALPAMLSTPRPVQIALTSTLMKLMTVDVRYCQSNVRLVFTLLQHGQVESVVKENLVVGLSDLMIRFPNVMEPWTPHIYDLLAAKAPLGLRRKALLVLIHLILSDMIKVKGHIAKMVMLMTEADPRLRSMATNFVNELAQKATRSSNPIYNLFPDILSNLLLETALPSEDFQFVVQYLLKFTNERHGEKLVEKLCLRFATEDRLRVWRGLAFAIKSLQLGERGFRKFAELLGNYRRALSDDRCFKYMKEVCTKAKRNARGNEVKTLVQVFEAELQQIHEEMRDDAMETESEGRSLADSELTFAEMTGVSGQKRKAEGQEEPGSVERLSGKTSRLERITEAHRRSSECVVQSASPDLVERRLSRLSISKEQDDRRVSAPSTMM